mgnify:CR=1 FL=1
MQDARQGKPPELGTRLCGLFLILTRVVLARSGPLPLAHPRRLCSPCVVPQSPGLSAVQLAAALGCPRPPGASPSPSPSPSPDRGGADDSAGRRRALGAVLQDLVGDFEVMRRGSGAVRSQVDLDDEGTTFHIL